MKMKTTTSTLILSLYLLSIFSIFSHSSLPAVARVRATTLHGTPTNDLIFIGVEYYIKPATTHYVIGGGLTLAKVGNETCPISIIQDPIEILYGLPVSFHPLNPEDLIIYLSTDLNIKFESPLPCAESMVWKVDLQKEHDGKHEFVTIGGELGKPGCDTVENWFRIEKYGIFYKFVYCPAVCESGEIICKDIGVLDEGRLVLTDDTPFTFLLVNKRYLRSSQ